MRRLVPHWWMFAAVASTILLFALAASVTYFDTVQSGKDGVERRTETFHEHARKVFDTVELILDLVDTRIAGRALDQIETAEMSAWLAAVNRRFDQTVSIWITDTEGKVRAGSQPWDETVRLTGRDFFDAHVERDIGTFIGAPFVGRATKIWSVAVSRRIGDSGRFKGTIHVSLSPEYFQEFYADVMPKEWGHSAILVRADGTILARVPPLPEPTRVNPDRSPLMQRIAAGEEAGMFSGISSLDGTRRLAVFQRVAPYPVYVFHALDWSALLGQWLHNLAIFGTVTGVASVILLLFSWLAIRRAEVEQAALKKMNQEMEQRVVAEERLRAGMRLETLGQITGGVAHDFNNLLMIIRGGADRVGRLDLPEKARRYVDAINNAVDRGARLTRQLLTFARVQPLQLETIGMGELLGRIQIALKSSLREDIGLQIEVPPDTWPVKIDAAQLELALINLAVNARDAMSRGGTFTLSVRNADIPSGPGGISGEFVVIEARDTGIGIPPDVIGRIFEPFFTTKGVGKGTGLGLSHVYGLALQAGGNVSVESEPGKGTCLSIYLPRSTEAVVTVTETSKQQHMVRNGHNRRVLLVEDNPGVAEMTEANLKDLGFQVSSASSAAEALALLPGDPAFDLVFADIVMPGEMNGIELGRTVRLKYPGLPVLLTTGYSDAIKAAAEDGFIILPKPFRQEQLATSIEATLAKAHAAPPVPGNHLANTGLPEASTVPG